MILLMYACMFWVGNCQSFSFRQAEHEENLFEDEPQSECLEIRKGPMPTDEVLI